MVTWSQRDAERRGEIRTIMMTTGLITLKPEVFWFGLLLDLLYLAFQQQAVPLHSAATVVANLQLCVLGR